jgi:hypothetical protein
MNAGTGSVDMLAGQTERTGRLEPDSKDMTARTGLLGRTAVM